MNIINEKIKYNYRVFTDYEIKQLLKNKNIIGIKSKKEIVYSNNFKLWSVQEKIKHPEKTAKQIFEEAGFDMNILDERTPQRRLSNWLKKYLKFGVNYFINPAGQNYYSSLDEKR